MRDPLTELLPRTVVPTRAIDRARQPFGAAVSDMLAVPDAALESAWKWRPDDATDADVRYGMYRIHEVLEEAIAGVERGRGSEGGERGEPMAPAVPMLAAATVARWALHGVLAPLGADAFDADPGGGEWTVRRTMAHITHVQRSYGWTSAWFLSRAGMPDAGEYAPEGTLPSDENEEPEGVGTPAEVRARLDDRLDAAAEHFGGIDEQALGVPGRWSGLPVTVGFRLGRLGSHIREHTIQVEKTLVMVGRPISEVERLVRLASESFGRLEATVFARPAADVERAFPDGTSAASIVEAGAAEAARVARSVREAVGP